MKKVANNFNTRHITCLMYVNTTMLCGCYGNIMCISTMLIRDNERLVILA